MALTDEQIDGIAAHLRCNSLEVTGLHSIKGPTQTILSPAGVREIARAVESAVLAGMEKQEPIACGLRTSQGVLHSLVTIQHRDETARTAKRMHQSLVLLVEATQESPHAD